MPPRHASSPAWLCHLPSAAHSSPWLAPPWLFLLEPSCHLADTCHQSGPTTPLHTQPSPPPSNSPVAVELSFFASRSYFLILRIFLISLRRRLHFSPPCIGGSLFFSSLIYIFPFLFICSHFIWLCEFHRRRSDNPFFHNQRIFFYIIRILLLHIKEHLRFLYLQSHR